jgi:hypothetical protein
MLKPLHIRGVLRLRAIVRGSLMPISWRFAQHDKIVKELVNTEAAAEQIPHRHCLAFARQRDSGWQFD